MKILYITNICSHYRVKLFEKIAERYIATFIFFSDGNEWYWEKRNQNKIGKFKGIQLRGFRLFSKIRITPGLISRLLFTNYDVVVKCINGKFALPFTFFISKVLRKPFILWTGTWMHPKSILHSLTFPLVKSIYRHSDAIVVYGEHVKKYLTGLGVPEEKIFIGWNTVDNSLFAIAVTEEEKKIIRRQLQLRDEKIMLFVGRLEEEKGLEHLVEAAAFVQKKIKSVLLMIGTGSYREKVESLGQKQEVRLIFLDYVKNIELYKYYALADVFILPSVTTKMVKETWGLVINEAMNQGCPVVTTNAVGAAMGGLVDHEKTGIVVPEADPEAMAGALSRILSDTIFAEKLRKNAIDKIVNWDYEHQVRGFEEAIRYASLTKRSHENK